MAEQAGSLNVTPEQLTQHPEAALLLMLLASLVIAVVIGFFVTAIVTVVRLNLGKPVLVVEPWTPRVWGLIDLILIVVLMFLVQWFVIGIWSLLTHFDMKQLRKEGDFPISAIAAGSLSYLITMALTMGWFGLRYGASLSHMGFTIAKLRSYVVLGVGATLLSLPPVYFVMWLVSKELNQEYDHPLLTSMMEEGTLSAFLLAMFSAVIAAPIWEEFLFRVVLQGWLESIPFSWKRFRWLTGAIEGDQGTFTNAETLALAQPGADEPDRLLALESPSNPYAPPLPLASGAATAEGSELSLGEPTSLDQPVSVPVTLTPPMWPVFVSGTLFGLAHLGYGLSFVPLILLGIILGFLYRATHSIWPSFVVHFILNLIAITQLGIITYIKSVVQ